MKHKKIKHIFTSLTFNSFLVVGVTGIFLYFHLFEQNIKDLHEILGLFFFGVVLGHIFFNWSHMKEYFPKNVFIISFVLIFLFSSFAIYKHSSENGKMSPKKYILVKTINAPLDLTFQLFDLESEEELVYKLRQNGIKVTDDTISLKEIAKLNQVKIWRVVHILQN